MEGGDLGLEAGRSKVVRCSRLETMWTCPELGLEGDARAMGEKGHETGRRGVSPRIPVPFVQPCQIHARCMSSKDSPGV